jgi:hypothetical protein
VRRSDRALAAVLLAASCGQEEGSALDGSDGTTGTTSTSSTGTTDGAAAETSAADSADVTSGGAADTGGIGGECSIWEQDCAEGDKCVPWSLEADLVPDEVRCCPAVANPALAGEECMVEDYFGSCLDNCELGSLCLDINNDGTGVCQPFCTGHASDPQCEVGEGCLIYFGGVPFCFPQCDPLIQDCPDGQGCYPSAEAIGGTDFLCLPHIGSAQLAEACWLLSNCDPGLICVSPEFFPDCSAPIGCCTTLCDTSEPDSCVVIDPGLECVSWYVGGQQPPSPALQNVGACVIPP